jgi:tetrapyrrole methylase family protein/MazG family protein
MQLTRKDYLAVLDAVELPPQKGLRIMDGACLTGRYVLPHAPDEFAVYGFSPHELEAIDLVNLARGMYPADYRLLVLFEEGARLISDEMPIDKFDSNAFLEMNCFLFFRPASANASLIAFRELIAHLRAPEGCPWDRQQTHQSLQTNLLEEAYEVLDAIDRQESRSLQEELGDLLLQIVLHAQIASEKSEFNLFDVIAGVHQKITFRHPHVFGDLDIAGVEGVTRNWEILKSQERSKKGESAARSILASVPNELPALSKAQKFQERAARVGFDWPNIGPVIEKFQEELDEFRNALNDQEKERELGDLLFALVNLIRWNDFDAESVLRQANSRFLGRFNFIEETMRSQGRKMTDLSLEEMDDIWEQAKRAEAGWVQTGQ